MQPCNKNVQSNSSTIENNSISLSETDYEIWSGYDLEKTVIENENLEKNFTNIKSISRSSDSEGDDKSVSSGDMCIYESGSSRVTLDSTVNNNIELKSSGNITDIDYNADSDSSIPDCEKNKNIKEKRRKSRRSRKMPGHFTDFCLYSSEFYVKKKKRRVV